ncbi:MAG TPA: peptidase C39 family protein [Symbiobacteriaceae bacterium]|nr:peptidase C39 family protein [Symbiobacteriaceae bacterium]
MPATLVTDFQVGTHEGTAAVVGGGVTAASGCWTSPAFDHEGPFNWAVASWNGTGDQIQVEVRVATPAGWSPWFSWGPWSLAGERHSMAGQSYPGIGKLDTDTLVLEQPVRSWQFRVTLQNATVKRLWLCHALREHRSAGAAHMAAWGRDLPVPLRSQMIYPNGGNVWCSPTSLAMVMAFWGHDESIPDQVVPAVYDSVYDGHGNWAFNAAYAGARGFVAWVDRFPSYGDLEQEIAAGRPVIASVAYNREWLPNAVYPKTGGHLLVVRGFTAEGDVIVNDPAAATNEGVHVVYRRDLFQRAWLDRGGVVYRICPEAQPD